MKVAVFGGGISGLTAAYYAKQQGAEVTLFEKSERVGGWLETMREPFFFEMGPRTFKTSRSLALLNLMIELGLKDQLIASAENAKARYLFLDGRLQRFPKPLFSWKVLTGLLREWSVAPRREDESIYEFAKRRFNKEVAERIFDALSMGVFAGDIHELSIENCFPFFKELEREYGSITKGMILRKKKKSPPPPFEAELFTLKNGTQSLVDALSAQVEIETGSDKTPAELKEHFDKVICALPFNELIRLFSLKMEKMDYRSIDVFHLGFKRNVLPMKGFGYLVPTRENKGVMGCIFDSSIFPQQNHSCDETRMTIMAQPQTSLGIILKELKEQLGLDTAPDFHMHHHLQDAIPQYRIGHREMIVALKAQMPSWCHLAGNYLMGASVNSCVLSGKNAAIPRAGRFCEFGLRETKPD